MGMHEIALTGDRFDWQAFQALQTRFLHWENEHSHSPLHIHLDFSGLKEILPNGFVPLIVLIEWLRQSTDVDFEIVLPIDESCRRFVIDSNYAAFLCPGQGYPISESAHALHRFANDIRLNKLIDSQIHQVLESSCYARGVLQSFEWMLNEVAGNVLVHAKVDHGWMQVVVDSKNQKMTIVVADGGIGIPMAIREAFPHLFSDEDAIAHALKEGITSRPDFGQGKGLTGTLQIVKINQGGCFSIHSQRGRVAWLHERLDIKGDFPPFPGTFVDIQLNTAVPIEIERALWGDAPAFPFSDALYGKDMPIGLMRMKLTDEAVGFGNRITALKIRNKIENLLISASNEVLEIDFSGVDLLASSFADEVFGKLALSLGFVGFGSRIRFININKFCRSIIDDVVHYRIFQSHVKKQT
jgi:anti-sigma regulatory factor (Ser/Thr protein kinase)